MKYIGMLRERLGLGLIALAPGCVFSRWGVLHGQVVLVFAKGKGVGVGAGEQFSVELRYCLQVCFLSA